MASLLTLTLMLLSSPLLMVSAAKLSYIPEMSIPQEHHSHHHHHRPKVHLFAVSGKNIPYNYINEFGKLVGFEVDLLQEVCSIAGKKCEMILGEDTECIFTYKHLSYIGEGMQSGWYSGCSGFEITIDRLNEFDFTLPYSTSSCGFFVKPGNPEKFDIDAEDYSKYKLVHVTGSSTNAQCLTRLRKEFDEENVLVAQDIAEATEMVLNGKADVVFSHHTVIAGLEMLPERVHCGVNGNRGIMLKKGSDVASWWNPAFRTFYQSGGYQTLCNGASTKYGASVKCLPSPAEASPELLTLLNKPDVQQPERLWKFVVSGAIAPYSYLNTEGELVGFTKDMIQEVCGRAGKSCILTLAQVSDCTKRVGETLYPQRGLLEGWFDACTGYFNTEDRRNSWDFTGPYLVSNATFKVLPGNPKQFDPSSQNFKNFTLVRVATAITNDHCLNRLHKQFSKLLVVDDSKDAEKAVLHGKADVWFTKEVKSDVLETLAPAVHCENVGTSVMVKKGSELPEWWDAAFHDFYMSGEFNQFCLDQGQIHTTDFPCLPPPPSIDHSKKKRGDREGF